MRILHFSDVHLGLKDFHIGYLFDKRFFGRLNQFVTRQRHLAVENLDKIAEFLRRETFECVVCTGDLASIGSSEEFEHARKLLTSIRKAANGHFLFVPGNHDAYIRQYHDCLKRIFFELNDGRVTLDDLPSVVEIGNTQFILLNPARPCLIWQSTGELSTVAWEKLDYILNTPRQKGKTRVLLSHFPLIGANGSPLSWRTKMLNGERLLAHARAKHFDAMLTGHVHHPFVHQANDEHPLLVGAGSLTIQHSFATVETDDMHAINATIHRLDNNFSSHPNP